MSFWSSVFPKLHVPAVPIENPQPIPGSRRCVKCHTYMTSRADGQCEQCHPINDQLAKEEEESRRAAVI